MVILALTSGAMLLLEYSVALSPAQLQIIDITDITIAIVFLFEFSIKFSRANDKKQYLKGHWWELLASIPVTTPGTQALRLLRLVRLLRLLRLNSGFRNIFEYLERFTSQTHVLRIAVVWILIALTGAGMFLGLERTAHIPALTYFDSVWWVVSTMSTVGYGDIYPLTAGGRLLAMVVMIAGVGAIGIFTALVASFFLKEK